MRRTLHVAAALSLALAVLSGIPAQADTTACTTPSKGSGLPKLTATTVSTLKQAYDCIFAHYYSGPVLDSRTLLAGAFAGFTEELQRQGLDHADATMPPLTGDKASDWTAFSAVYEKVLPDGDKARQALAAATMKAMVAALHDNHAGWDRPLPLPESATKPKPQGKDKVRMGIAYGTGIARMSPRPQDAAGRPPLFVAEVLPGSPAARARLRAGDVILAVNGRAPLVDGVLTASTVKTILQEDPSMTGGVRLKLRRPSTGRTWTVTLKPALIEVAEPPLTAKRLSGDLAYVRLPGFFGGAADQVLKAIADLRKKGALRGVVLDLRGNGGGSPREVTRLLGAFVHGKTTSYFCDVKGACSPNRTDDSVPLLDLPLVALTDRDCASACDDFSAAVKDLHLGTLVGTRTAGIVSGPGAPFLLDDGSVLDLPAQHHLGPNKELVDTIGVAPDQFVPLTAKDVSTGREPGLAKAVSLLS